MPSATPSARPISRFEVRPLRTTASMIVWSISLSSTTGSGKRNGPRLDWHPRELMEVLHGVECQDHVGPADALDLGQRARQEVEQLCPIRAQYMDDKVGWAEDRVDRRDLIEFSQRLHCRTERPALTLTASHRSQ